MIGTQDGKIEIAPERTAEEHQTSGPPYVIAGWRFDPTMPLLEREGEVRSLEDRAARVLALLCRRRGEVVGKDVLIAEVWSGRSVSGNSVSIVMGGLRRALGDDPANPSIIVTVARRGYRLTCDDQAETLDVSDDPPSAGLARGATVRWIAAGLLSAMLVAGGWTLLRPPADLTIAAPPPENASGDADYDRLAASLAPVVSHGVNRLPGVVLLDGTAGQHPRITLTSKVILWNGAPELALSATDTRTHAVIWSAFAAGPPGLLARHVEDRIAGLGRHLPR